MCTGLQFVARLRCHFHVGTATDQLEKLLDGNLANLSQHLSSRIPSCQVLLGTLGVLVAGQDNGGVIEVKNGDLRINLGEVGGKVYVSVKGGPEIELFALAARVKALEDAAQSNDGNDTGMQDDLDNLRVKVR